MSSKIYFFMFLVIIIIQGISGNKKCKKPRWDPTLYKDCKPSDSEEFPSEYATCSCMNCDVLFQLQCKNDEKWYLTEQNVCYNLNTTHNRCGHPTCTNDKIPNNIVCEFHHNNSIKYSPIKECRCKANFLKIKLDCTESGWKITDEFACDDVTSCRIGLILVIAIPISITFGILITLIIIIIIYMIKKRHSQQSDQGSIESFEIHNLPPATRNSENNQSGIPEYLPILGENIYDTPIELPAHVGTTNNVKIAAATKNVEQTTHYVKYDDIGNVGPSHQDLNREYEELPGPIFQKP